MALANILQPNSYSIIEQVVYSKHKKEFSCILSIFSDSAKFAKLTELYFHVNGQMILEEVDDVNIEELPADCAIGSTYIVSKTPHESLQEYAGKTITWKGEMYPEEIAIDKKMFEISSSENNIVWVKNKSCYCKVIDGFPAVDYVSAREFQAYFSPSIVEEIGLVAASYNYVKSKPLAQSAVDC